MRTSTGKIRISTSFAERQNWTVRTTMRCYTPLSNGFSRKLENHAAAPSSILPTISSSFIVHFACLRPWPLALGIGSGA